MNSLHIDKAVLAYISFVSWLSPSHLDFKQYKLFLGNGCHVALITTVRSSTTFRAQIC